MNITLATSSLKGYGLNRIFELAKEAGFDGIELEIDLKNVDTQNAHYIAELQKETNIPIVALGIPEGTNKKKITEFISLAQEIGSAIVILQAPKVFDVKLANWYKTEVPKIRKEKNISIALENAPATTIFGFIPEHSMNNLAELQKFKHVCFATDRIVEHKEDLIISLKKMMKYLVHIHVSNIHKGRGGQLPHNGILPMESFLTKLASDGYKGALSIKVNPKYLSIGNDEQVVAELSTAIKYCKKYLGE